MTGEGEPARALLYDADCGLCAWLVAGVLRWDRAGRLRPVSLQGPEALLLLADLGPEERMASWHLVAPGGERRSGGAALAPLLRLLPGGEQPAAALGCFPEPTERAYRWVADHRTGLGRLVPEAAKRRARARVKERERSLRATG